MERVVNSCFGSGSSSQPNSDGSKSAGLSHLGYKTMSQLSTPNNQLATEYEFVHLMLEKSKFFHQSELYRMQHDQTMKAFIMCIQGTELYCYKNSDEKHKTMHNLVGTFA